MNYVLKKDLKLDKIYVGYNFLFPGKPILDFIIICDDSLSWCLGNSVKKNKHKYDNFNIYYIDELTYNRIVVDNYCRLSNGIVASVIG